ncbi:FecCD family ABC transporter permease [Homoserinibacter sp. YIM 151385]|uniref:FecCD family ABC transporter permease n=1 Tax=Homoserinibacter sp. YIM 151385 TaxID=2985506 RepID=UPI0022F027F9|nr:iron ABC transporter permease [Homoserinibacter sp. YIM 151385]WBU37060.1 iron ABC transporter permease [Homoserinibacter sp. YIM 151385]
MTATRAEPQRAAATVGRAARRIRIGAVAAVLAGAIVLAIVVSAGAGQLALAPGETLRVLLAGPDAASAGHGIDPASAGAVWTIRVPRILLAALVGAALAVSGGLMQAVFANPLADPGVVGVSAGAALGAALAIVLGWTALGSWTVAAAAFVAALGTTLFVVATARAEGRTEVVTLVLTGIAITAFSGAGLALMTFLGDTTTREQIVFWQLGTLGGTRWHELAVLAPIALLGIVAAVLLGRRLDALALGEREAGHLGVDVERLRTMTIVLVALLTGTAVAFTGIIGFVGLVVPHIVRMAIGPAHRPLLAVSALGGALLVLAADTTARTVVPGAELPIGMLTTLIGGPYFFYLLRRMRRATGSWA